MGSLSSRFWLSIVAGLSLVAVAAPVGAHEISRCEKLPAPVAAKRDAIAEAAAAGDLEALASLTDPDGFTYSFGDGEGALAYWQRMRDEEGVGPAELIAGVLGAGCAHFDEGGDSFYVWPAAALIDYPDLNAHEIAALQAVYNGELESFYVEGFDVGYYLGWRLYLEEDGRWTSFVAGD